MNTEARTSAAHQEVDAFAQGGPTDSMHVLLVTRADALTSCMEGSPEEAELANLTDAIAAYEAVRGPDG